jgi:hypothetical protein
LHGLVKDTDYIKMDLTCVPNDLLYIIGKFIAKIDSNVFRTWLILMSIVKSNYMVEPICLGMLANFNWYVRLSYQISAKMRPHIKCLDVPCRNIFRIPRGFALNNLRISNDHCHPLIVPNITLLNCVGSNICHLSLLEIKYNIQIIFATDMPRLEKISSYLLPMGINYCTHLKELSVTTTKSCIVIKKNIFPPSLNCLKLHSGHDEYIFNPQIDDCVDYRYNYTWYASNDTTCTYHLNNFDHCTCLPQKN